MSFLFNSLIRFMFRRKNGLKSIRDAMDLINESPPYYEIYWRQLYCVNFPCFYYLESFFQYMFWANRGFSLIPIRLDRSFFHVLWRYYDAWLFISVFSQITREKEGPYPGDRRNMYLRGPPLEGED